MFFRYRLQGSVTVYSDMVEWYWNILEGEHPPVRGYDLTVEIPGPMTAPYDAYVHRLGNLALLSRRKNAQAQNFDFDDKKQKYFSSDKGISPFVLTTQVLQQREWTPQVVSKRQELALAKLSELWRL